MNLTQPNITSIVDWICWGNQLGGDIVGNLTAFSMFIILFFVTYKRSKDILDPLIVSSFVAWISAMLLNISTAGCSVTFVSQNIVGLFGILTGIFLFLKVIGNQK